MTLTLAKKTPEGVGYEWDVTDPVDGYLLGTLLRDSEGIWYAQDRKADFVRFEVGTDDYRKARAIAWLEARN